MKGFRKGTLGYEVTLFQDSELGDLLTYGPKIDEQDDEDDEPYREFRDYDLSLFDEDEMDELDSDEVLREWGFPDSTEKRSCINRARTKGD